MRGDGQVINTLGPALDFDGSTTWVDAGKGNGDNLVITGDVTMEAWAKFDAFGTDTIFRYGGASGDGDAGNNILYKLRANSGGDLVYEHESGDGSSGDVALTFDTNLATDTWYHIAASRDVSAKSVTLYINGEIFQTQTYTQNNPDGGAGANAKLALGARTDNQEFLDGQLADMRVWKSARTAKDIQDNYNHLLDGNQGGDLVLNYQFRETTDNTLVDASGSQSGTGTVNGAVTYVNTAPDIFGTKVTVQENETASGQMTANDLIGTPTFTVFDAVDTTPGATLTIANKGKVEIDSDTGAWTFVPDAGVTGDVTFTLRATANSINDDEQITISITAETHDSVDVHDGALELDGVNDFVQIDGSSFNIGGSQSFTMEAWVRQQTSATGNDLIFGKGTPGNTTNGQGLQLQDNGTIRYLGVSSSVTGVTAVNDGAWHHVAVSFEASSDTVRLYVDGVLDKTGTLDIPASASTMDFYMGSLSGSNQFYRGGIDEVRLWDDVRTEAEIKANTDQQLTNLGDASLKAYYRFDDDASDTHVANLATSTGSALDGIIRGGGQIINTLGNALDFDGATNHIVVGKGASDNLQISTDLTLETWIKFDTLTGDSDFIRYGGANGDGDGADNILYKLRVNSSGNIEYLHESGTGSTQVDLTFNAGLTTGVWYHLAVSRDVSANQVSLYVDGKLFETKTYTGADPAGGTNGPGLTVGNNVDQDYVDGQMADVRVWKTARTAKDIADNYNMLLTGNQGGDLVLNYQFRETTDEVVVDASGTQSNATITGPVKYVDTAPDIFGTAVTLQENENAQGQMVGSDVYGTPVYKVLDGSSTAQSSYTQSGKGTLSIDSDTGAWTFVPVAGFSGTATFTLRASAGGVNDDEAVTFTINAETHASVNVHDGAVPFDGVNDFIDLGSPSALAFGANPFTIETWIRTGVTSNTRLDVAALGHNTTLNQSAFLFIENGKLAFDTSGSADVIGTSAINDQQWHHVAVTRDGTTIKLYVDGVLETTGSVPSFTVPTATSRIGSPTGVDNFFRGEMNDFRIWNDVRTEAEIKANMDQQLTGDQGGSLIVHYNYDDDHAGTTVADSAGTAQNGTLTNGAQIINTLGNALQLDGAGDYVWVPHAASLNASQWSIEAWFQTTAHGADAGRIVSKPITGNNGYSLLINNGKLMLATNGASPNTIQSASNYNDGAWHHAAGVYDGNQLKLYVDGALVQSSAVSGTVTLDTNNLYIGSFDGTQQYFNGKIDGVRVWNTARTDGQIAENYNQTLAGSHTGLVANYTFDEIVDGTQVIDQSGNQSAATVNGDAKIVDTAPDVFGTAVNIQEGETASGQMQGFDVYGTPTFSLTGAGAADAQGRVSVTTSNSGTVIIDQTTGAWTYTPAANFNGTDTFVVTAAASGVTDSETITVTVSAESVASVNVNDGAVQLDGVNDYVDIPDTVLNHTQGTVSAKFSFAGVSGAANGQRHYLFANKEDNTGGSAGGDRVYIFMEYDSANAKWKVGATLDAQTIEGGFVDLNTWTDVALVWRSDNTGEFYVNGDSKGSVSGLTLDASVQNNVAIGTYDEGSAGQFFKGSVDEVAVWNVSRTAEQVRDTRETQLTGDESGLVAYYRLDDSDATTTVRDVTGNHNDGTLTNGAEIVNNLGKALKFTNSGDHMALTASNGLDFGTGDFSIEAWIRLDQVGVNQAIIDNRGATDFQGYLVGVGADNKLRLGFSDGADGTTINHSGSATLSAGQWYHVAVTLDRDGDAQIYLDGVADGTTVSIAGETQTVGTGAIQVGRESSASGTAFTQFKGAMADLRFWNDVRTAAEIADNSNATLTGTESNLVGHYTFEEIVSGSAIDNAGTANDGAVSGATLVDAAPTVLGTKIEITADEVASGRMTTNDIVGTPATSFSVVGGTAAGGVSTLSTSNVGTVRMDQSSGAWTFDPDANFTGTHTFTLRASDGAGGAPDDDEVITVTVKSGDLVNVSDGVVQFDGTGDQIDIGSDAAFQFGSGTFTVETWIRTGVTSNSRINIIDLGNTSTANQGAFLYIEDGKLEFDSFTSANQVIGTSAINDQEWHHVAMTRNGTSIKLYVDGELETSGTIPAFTVGAPSVTNTIGTTNFKSRMDDFRIWNTERTADEIRVNYDQQLAGSETGLVAYYKFDDDHTSTTVADSAETAQNGTLVNQAAVNNVPNHALKFDGTDDYVEVAHDAALNPTHWTVEAWFKSTGHSGSGSADMGRIVTKGIDASNNGYSLALLNGKLRVDTNGLSTNTLTSTNNVNDGNWHHGAFVYDGNTIKLYVDGQLDQVVSVTGTVSLNTSALNIGRYQYGNWQYFNGEIGEARVWNTGRTDAEILDNYNQTLTGDQGGKLVAHYTFDEGSGTTLTDNAGTAHNGTINGATYVDVTPNIYGNAVTIQEDETVSGVYEGDAASYAVATAASNGTVTLDTATGHWIYKPNTNFYGTDTFKLSADGGGEETITVTVNREDHASVNVSDGIAQFDGVEDSVVADLGTSTFTNQITMEAWVNYADTSTHMNLIHVGDTANDTGRFVLERLTDGQFNFFLGKTSASTSVDSGTSSGAGEWHHVAMSYDGTTAKIYVDANLVKTQAVSGATLASGAQKLSVGSDKFAFDGKALMDDVRVWDDVRTAEEIRDNYQKQLTGSEANLQVYYRFDDEGEAGKVQNRGALGDTADGSIGQGQVLSLDGTGDYVEVANPTNVDFAATVTVEAWVKTTASGALQAVVGKTETGTWQVGGKVFALDAVGRMYFGNHSAGTVVGSTRVNDGQWHHVAWTITEGGATDTVRMYVDGNLETISSVADGASASGTQAATLNRNADSGAHELKIGSLTGTGGDAYYFNGQIDDVRIWNTARTEAEIQANKDTTLLGTETGLVRYFEFDHDQFFIDPANAVDDKKGGGDGTLNGNAQVIDALDAPAATVNDARIVNSLKAAMNFDGTDDLVRIADADALDLTSAITIEAWIKPNDISGTEYIVGKAAAYTLSMANAELQFAVNGEGRSTTTVGLTANTWQHVALTFDNAGKLAKFYVDGEFVEAIQFTNALTASNNVLDIGALLSTSDDWNGQLADVRLWNVARTGAEIAENFNRPVSGNEGGALVAHYTFDEASGATATDSAGSNNGTITGATRVDLAPDVFGTKLTVQENETAQGQMTPSDVVGTATYSVQTAPNNAGTVSIDSNGNWTYTPAANFNGTETFTLRATDGTRNDDETITVTVNAVSGKSVDVSGSVLALDGSNDYATVRHDAGLNNSVWTIETWFQTSSHTASGDSNIGRLISKAQGTGGNQFSIYMSQGKLNLVTNGLDTSTVTTTDTYNDGAWHHVSGVYDGSTLKLYVDGDLVQQASVSGTPTLDTKDLNMGAFDDGSGATQFFNGKLDEVRVWTEARTDAEIRANYDQQLSGSEPNLEAYYRFDDDAIGTTARDQAGNGHDLDLVNGAAISDVTGKALSFAGGTNHVNITGSTSDFHTGSGAFTYEAWIKMPSSSSGNHYIFSSGGSTNNTAGLFFVTGGKLALHNPASHGVTGTTTINDDVWHHVAAVHSGSGAITLYIDGKQEATGTASSGFSISSGAVTIGSSPFSGQNMNGQIADVRIWKDARTANEIKQTYQSPPSGSEDNLVAHYTFDEASTTAVTDQSGNGHSGTISGATKVDSTAPIEGPEIFGTTIETVEATAVSGFMTSGDVTAAGTLSYSLQGSVSNGAVTVAADGKWTYTPNANFTGTESFTIRASDGTRNDDETITVTVTSNDRVNVADGVLRLGDTDGLDAGRGAGGELAITGNVTVEAWVNLADLKSQTNVIAQFAGPSENQADNALYALRINAQGDLVFFHETGSGSNTEATFDANLTTDTWVHVAMVRDATAKTINAYVDGNQVGTAVSYANNPDGGTSSTFVLGEDNASSSNIFTEGMIDELRIWSTARTADEIRLNYDQQVATNATGLVANYRFDDDDRGTILNDSTSANSTINLAGHVMDMDKPAANDVATGMLASGFANAPTSAITVEMWIKPDLVDGSGLYSYAVDPGGALSDNHFFLEMETNGDLEVYRHGSTAIITGVGITAGEWQHLAVKWDSTSDTATVYKNGVEIGTGAVTGNDMLQGGTVSLGNDQDSVGGGFAAGSAYDGKMAEVRVWNVSRDAADIAADYDQTLKGDETGLVRYWRLNESDGTVATDQTGTGHGTYQANLTTHPQGDTPPIIDHDAPRIVGTLGQAMKFDGTGDVITTSGIDLNNKSFSWEFWANHEGTSGLVLGARDVGDDGPNDFLHAGWTSSTNFRFSFNGTGSDSQIDYVDSDGSQDAWAHWAGTYDATTNTGKLYKNGQLVASAKFENDLNTPAALLIGGSQAGQNYTGLLDEVRIWYDVRTADEIADNYNLRIAGDADNLVANYHFDAASGNAIDSATGVSGSNDGTLSGDTARVDTAPDVFGNAVTVNENETVSGQFETTATSVSKTDPSNGTLTLNTATGDWTYAPNSGYIGTDSFTLTAGGRTETISVTVTDTDENSVNVAGGALQFTGRSYDRMEADLGNGTLTNQLTVEALIRFNDLEGPSAQDDQQNFLNLLGSSNKHIFNLFKTGADEIRLFLNDQFDGSFTTATINSGVTVSADTWYHVAATYDGTTAKLYMDGSLVGQAAVTGATWAGQTAELIAGGNPIAEPNLNPGVDFRGLMDEVRVWSVARTEAEINANKDQALTGKEGHLEAYYTVDGDVGSTIQDKTANNRDATLANGQVLTLDGTGDFVQIADDNSLDVTSAITVETWFKTTGTEDFSTLMYKVGTSGSGPGWKLGFGTDGTLRGDIQTTGTNRIAISSSDRYDDGQWHHVAMTYDNTNNPILYVDGIDVSGTVTLVGAATVANHLAANDGALMLGEDPNLAARDFNGQMDEVRIWSDVRTAEEIQAHMNDTLKDTPAGLVAYYTFDDDDAGTSKTHTDVTGTYNGTGQGDAAVQPASGGRSLFLDGQNDYVTIANDAALNSANWTIEGWFNTTHTGTANSDIGRIVSKLTDAGWNVYTLVVFDGKVRAGTSNANTDAFDAVSLTDVNDGQWHHAAASYDGTSLKLYVDGVLHATTAVSGSPGTSTQSVSIGRSVDPVNGSIQYFDGGLDDIRIWNSVRTADEIADSYNTVLSGNQGGDLVAQYTFNDDALGANDTISNTASGSHNGTATNGATVVSGSAVQIGSPVDSKPDIVNSLGKVFEFNGSTHVDAGTGVSNSLLITGDLTVEGWVSLDTVGAVQNIATFGASGETQATNALYQLRVDSGGDIGFLHETGGGSNTDLTFDTNLVADQWYHLSAVRDAAAKTVSVYVNGQLFGTKSYTSNADGGTSGTLKVGADTTGGGQFDGQMSDLRIWKAARTAEEIADAYNQRLAGNQGGDLVLNYTFDEVTGTTVPNTTGTTINGTVTGTATLVDAAAPVFADGDAPVILDDALSLDGTNDYLAVAGSTELDVTTNFTLEAWVYSTDATGTQNVFSRDNVGSDVGGGYNFGILNGTGLFYETNNSAGADVIVNNAVTPNAWNHIAITNNNGSYVVYVNGAQVGTGTEDSPSAFGTSVSLLIDRRGNDNTADFTGRIDEARIWNVTRTAAEIAATYDKQIVGDEGGALVANYSFDEIVSTDKIDDGAGTNNQGTLTNNATTTSEGAPLFGGTKLTINEGETASGRMTGNDVSSSGTTTYSVAASPEVGSLSIDSTSGEWIYTPPDNHSGDVSFAVKATNGTQTDTETVTVTVTADAQPNVAGGVMQFNDTAGMLLVGQGKNDELVITGDLTAEAWVNPVLLGSSTFDQEILTIAGPTGDGVAAENILLTVQIETDGDIQITHETGVGTNRSVTFGSSDGVDINANTWTHVAVTRDVSANTYELFLNGVSKGTKTYTADPTGGENAVLTIGGSGDPDGNGFQLFGGQMDDVRVWNVKRTAEEIADNYDKQLTGNESGLKAYYTFDDSKGGVIDDRSASDNDAVIVKAGAQASGSNVLTLARADSEGVTAAFGNGTLTNTFTMEAWVKQDTRTPTVAVVMDVSDNAGSNADEAAIQILQDGRFHVWMNAEFVSTSTVPLDEWTHLALTYDGTNIRMYMNGQQVTIDTDTTTFAFEGTDAETLYLGRNDGSGANYFDGQMDEVRVWNVARTQAEIQQSLYEKATGTETGLVGLYSFDTDNPGTSGSVADTAGTAQNGTLENGATISPVTTSNASPINVEAAGVVGPEGRALQLDGTGDDVLATLPDGTITNTVTLEAWMIFDTDGFETPLALKSGNTVGDRANPRFVVSKFDDGKLRFWFQDDNGTEANDGTILITTDKVLDIEVWHHIAVTYDGSTAKAYVDGAEVGSASYSGFSLNTGVTQELTIGSDAGALTTEMDGRMDNVRVWSSARTADQIREGMTQSYDYDTSNLVAQYTFEDVSGSTVRDAALSYSNTTRNNAEDGTLRNDAKIVDIGTDAPMVLPGFENAASFDGSNDNISLGTLAPFGTAARTFMVWAKTTSTAQQVLFGYGAAGTGTRVDFGFNTWDTNHSGIGIDMGSGTITYDPVTDFADGLWHHYALVFPSGGDSVRDFQIYQDGQLLSAVTGLYNNTDVAVNTTSANLYLGAEYDGSGKHFNGNMAEASVWSTALTGAQIRDYMTQSLSGSETGLAGYWKLDEGSGTSVADSSNGGNAGTMNGATWTTGLAPNIEGTSHQIVEDGTATGQMTAADVSGTPTYTLVNAPLNGTVDLNGATGHYTYTPNTDYQGNDSFVIRATGATSGTDDETVSVDVGRAPSLEHNHALSLDGSGDGVIISNAGDLVTGTGSFTAEAWIKTSTAVNYQSVFQLGVPGNTGTDDILIRLDSGGKVQTTVASVGSAVSTTNVADGAWHHIAMTFDDSTHATAGRGRISVLVDGVVEGTLDGTLAHDLVSTGAEARIGYNLFDVDKNFFNGQIDEVRFWDKARTASEIQADMDRKMNGDEANLKGYWSFDEGAGNTVAGNTSGDFDGAFVGDAKHANLTTVKLTNNETYKGLLLGEDADADGLSYSLASGPSQGTFTLDTDANTYTYQSNSNDGEFDVSINVTDEHGQVSTETITFQVT